MGSYARSLQGRMLANLTSLIWGSGDSAVTATTTTTVTPSPDLNTTTTTTTTTKDAYEDTPEGFTSFNLRATTPTDEEEADWLLVDRAEVGEASCGGVDTIASATDTSPSALTTTITSRAATSTPVPPVTLGGEWGDGGTQGWLMTPPPCFTRSQPAPLASSSLENLLIEHPSMSVYLPRPTYTSAATTRVFTRHVVAHSTPSSCSPSSASPSSQPAVMEREVSPMRENTENTEEQVENQVAEAPPAARAGVAQRAPSLLRAIDVLRPAQKAQRRREERRLKRSALERSNKVREVAAAGNKRSKRCDLMAPGKFSRAVNNRKC